MVEELSQDISQLKFYLRELLALEEALLPPFTATSTVTSPTKSERSALPAATSPAVPADDSSDEEQIELMILSEEKRGKTREQYVNLRNELLLYLQTHEMKNDSVVAINHPPLLSNTSDNALTSSLNSQPSSSNTSRPSSIPRPSLFSSIPTFKFETLPTLSYNPAPWTVAHFFVSSQHAEKILSYVSHKNFLLSLNICSLVVCVLYFLIFFEILPKNILSEVILIFTAVSFIPLMLSPNLQVLTHLLVSFDSWYLFIQFTSFVIEFAFLIQDSRICLVLAYYIFVSGALILDAQPKNIRKLVVPIHLLGFLFLATNFYCLRYNEFPNIVEYNFEIGGKQWSMQQLIASTLINMMIFSVKHVLFSMIRPDECNILITSVQLT